MQTFLEYVQWWYSYGFIRMLKYLKSFIIILADTFSVRICFVTFFSPWRRDVANTEGLALDQKLKVWGFNLLSRAFGMVIKTITLLIFLAAFVVLLCFELASIIIWLLLPVILVEGIVFGILYLI